MDGETSDELMHATYCALCEHGYAAVTMQDIADESDKSKAALHYHYESKHDLLLAFLDHLLADFTRDLESVTGETPQDRLRNLIDTVFEPSVDASDETSTRADGASEPEPRREFGTAILEIKAQGPYDEAFRERLAEFDRRLAERVRTVIDDGIETGVFRADVDPDTAAEFFVTAFSGAMTRQVAIGKPVDATRDVLIDYIETRLLADGVAAE